MKPLQQIAKFFFTNYDKQIQSNPELKITFRRLVYFASKVEINYVENPYDAEINLYFLSKHALDLVYLKHANNDLTRLFSILNQSSYISFQYDFEYYIKSIINVYDHPLHIASLPRIIEYFLPVDRFIRLLPYIETLISIRLSYDKDQYPHLWKDNIPDTIYMHKAFDVFQDNYDSETVLEYLMQFIPYLPDKPTRDCCHEDS